MKKKKIFRITTKFVLWFLFIALVPLAIATYISYNSSREVLEEEIARSLVAIADNKANQIEAYLREKKKNAAMLSRMSDMVNVIEKFDKAFDNGGIDSPEYSTVEQEFRPFLKYYQELLGYDDLFLINPYGNVIFSVKGKQSLRSIYETGRYTCSRLHELFAEVYESSETKISDFEWYPETNEGAVYIAAPVLKGGAVIGVVMVQVGNRGVYELVWKYKGLGKTGETLVASKIKDEVVFITPFRFDPDAAFRRRITIGSQEGLAIQKAVQGKEGWGRSIDYRDKQVLAVWRYLPSFRWGIVVKMDTSEVFGSATRLRTSLLKISLLLLAAVVIMATGVAGSISSPIKELTRISSIIAGGDLSARARINARDEIGELAHSFNQMTDSLVQAKTNVEQKKNELEGQKKLLEKVNKELDSFTYTASHDLRAPLRGITSFATFLEEDYKDKLDEEGKDYLKEIREGTKRMDMLIGDLLKLSRISRIENPYEDTDINDLINEIIERIKFDVTEYKVDLKIQKNMPTVHCDRIKMSEVFLNLINNAIKYSSRNKEGNPKVEVDHADEDKFYRFSVKDNGIGIDPKDHEKAFGMFKRIQTTEKFEGTGAGLAIVKRIVDDHSGKIWIESELGKGATFHFTIPKSLKEEKKGKAKELFVEDRLITEQKIDGKVKKEESEEVEWMPRIL